MMATCQCSSRWQRWTWQPLSCTLPQPSLHRGCNARIWYRSKIMAGSVTLCSAQNVEDSSLNDVGDNKTAIKVLLYVPNLIGYFRLGLLFYSSSIQQLAPMTAFWLFVVNFSLDGFDGVLARRLNQVSAFGAFLDVWIDILVRGTLWSTAFPGLPGLLPIVLEMTTFVCTHKGGGKAWKEGCFKDAPRWIQAIMRNNFKTPPGAFVVLGLMGAPLWCWACRVLPGTVYSHPLLGLLFLSGRLVGSLVELWIIKCHLAYLIADNE